MRSSREILMNCKKVQFSGEIQTQETGIDNGFYLNQGGIDVIRNCCFLKINVARFARKSDFKNVSSKNHCRLKYDQGEGKFPTLRRSM